MLSAHELLGFMSKDRALEILLYAYENDKPLYHTALNAVAQARHLRPVYMERQPRSQRHDAMLVTLTRPTLEPVSANLVRTWLVKKQTAVLTDFLDALGIAHKEGVVEELPKAIPDAQLQAAVDALLAKHPAEIVTIYLNAFNEMNEVDWPNLKTMLAADKRLQLGG